MWNETKDIFTPFCSLALHISLHLFTVEAVFRFAFHASSMIMSKCEEVNCCLALCEDRYISTCPAGLTVTLCLLNIHSSIVSLLSSVFMLCAKKYLIWKVTSLCCYVITVCTETHLLQKPKSHTHTHSVFFEVIRTRNKMRVLLVFLGKMLKMPEQQRQQRLNLKSFSLCFDLEYSGRKGVRPLETVNKLAYIIFPRCTVGVK